MASGLLGSRGVLTLGLHYQHVCRSVLVTQTRQKKRWMKAYTRIMEAKLKLEGPPPPKPRSEKPNWDFHAEVEAFGTRLQENFQMERLKAAFVNPCYVRAEQERRGALGVESETAALALKDNAELRARGLALTRDFLSDWCRASFPSLPAEGAAAVVDHLMSPEVVCHVARNLGVDDLTMSAEFPVPDDVLYGTFCAVVAVLEESSGPQRVGLFLRDFLSTQLIGKDLFDLWSVVNPMGLLVEECTRRGLPLPEPRLLRSAGASTVLPLFFVGLYCDKRLLAEGPGETLLAAEEEAARVGLRKLYGYTENRRPLDFSPAPQLQTSQGNSQALSSG
ncbi:39S ribosomal protein L44, mitochondrial [Sardina pilchardus]|uniref:39S ribosomal protein L44, mitochondrial n=1 Tax=Sardina pilchardus TaxID=27697 RepID=UPI002E0EA773